MINAFFWENMTRAANAYLCLDPDIKQRLAPLTDKKIKVVLTDLPLELCVFIQFKETEIVINNQNIEKIDAELKGSSVAFIKKGLISGSSAATAIKDIEVVGDVEVGQHLNKLMSDLEIDWEELLSQYTGDVLAYQIGTQVRNSFDWLKTSVKTAMMNITEYVQEEVHHFPSRAEIEDFYADVDELGMDFARLEARCDLLCEDEL